jgi:hypothetical protein
MTVNNTPATGTVGDTDQADTNAILTQLMGDILTASDLADGRAKLAGLRLKFPRIRDIVAELGWMIGYLDSDAREANPFHETAFSLRNASLSFYMRDIEAAISRYDAAVGEGVGSSADLHRIAADIGTYKERVRAMIEEAAALDDARKSSIHWLDNQITMKEFFEIPNERLVRARLYGSFFTGFPYPIPMVEGIKKSLPEKYWGSEPNKYYDPSGFSVHDGGYWLNSDTTKQTLIMYYMKASGVLQKVEERAAEGERSVVMEIGPGFGGGPVTYRRAFGDKVVVVVVDLPESLLLSSSHIRGTYPDARIWMYDPRVASDFPEDWTEVDFILLPNYRSDLISRLPYLNYVVNCISMQEMRAEDIEEYCQRIKERLDGVFFSMNLDRHDDNPELESLSDILARHFFLLPKPATYETQKWNKARRYIASVDPDYAPPETLVIY